jgi:hypothetical protein
MILPLLIMMMVAIVETNELFLLGKHMLLFNSKTHFHLVEHEVAQLVEALCYKLMTESRCFNYICCRGYDVCVMQANM